MMILGYSIFGHSIFGYYAGRPQQAELRSAQRQRLSHAEGKQHHTPYYPIIPIPVHILPMIYIFYPIFTYIFYVNCLPILPYTHTGGELYNESAHHQPRLLPLQTRTIRYTHHIICMLFMIFIIFYDFYDFYIPTITPHPLTPSPPHPPPFMLLYISYNIEYNNLGRIGGDSGLSTEGVKYAKELAEFVETKLCKDEGGFNRCFGMINLGFICIYGSNSRV
jgi:hypothetical protein